MKMDKLKMREHIQATHPELYPKGFVTDDESPMIDHALNMICDPREYFLTNFSRLDRDGMADVAAHAFDLLDTHDKATVLAATVLLVPPATEPARARKINCIARMLERMKDDDEIGRAHV